MDKKMKNNYQTNYDSKSDSLWVVFKTGPEAYFKEVVPGINLEFNDENQLMGIEILDYMQKIIGYSIKTTKQPFVSSKRTINMSQSNFDEDISPGYLVTTASPKNTAEIYNTCLQ